MHRHEVLVSFRISKETASKREKFNLHMNVAMYHLSGVDIGRTFGHHVVTFLKLGTWTNSTPSRRSHHHLVPFILPTKPLRSKGCTKTLQICPTSVSYPLPCLCLYQAQQWQLKSKVQSPCHCSIVNHDTFLCLACF